MATAPENSIESYLLAGRSGADGLKLDIRITRDGVPIVLHDATLARVAAASGPLTDTPVANWISRSCSPSPWAPGTPS
jgi:glycerophosphoryl diester phosphodiesterase